MNDIVEWDMALAVRIIADHAGRAGALLPILHDLQSAFGCVPEEAVRPLAEALNLSRAEIHGVITFYHEFRRVPPGRHMVHLCQAEACQAMGSRDLAERACATLGIGLGETTADRAVTLQSVYCLGLCATAPSAMVDGRVFGRMTPARLDDVLAHLA